MGSVSQVKEGTTCETTKQVVEKRPAHRTRRHDKSALHPTAAEQGFGREGGEWFGNNYFHLCRSYWPYDRQTRWIRLHIGSYSSCQCHCSQIWGTKDSKAGGSVWVSPGKTESPSRRKWWRVRWSWLDALSWRCPWVRSTMGIQISFVTDSCSGCLHRLTDASRRVNSPLYRTRRWQKFQK